MAAAGAALRGSYSAAATRSTRHCDSIARNAAGLSGLCST